MPLDPFFSSQNKKHYIPVDGVDELYQKLKHMSFDERKREMDLWKDRGRTKVENIVLRKLIFDFHKKDRAKVVTRNAKYIAKAVEEYKAGKRDIVKFYEGFNTAS